MVTLSHISFYVKNILKLIGSYKKSLGIVFILLTINLMSMEWCDLEWKEKVCGSIQAVENGADKAILNRLFQNTFYHYHLIKDGYYHASIKLTDKELLDEALNTMLMLLKAGAHVNEQWLHEGMRSHPIRSILNYGENKEGIESVISFLIVYGCNPHLPAG